MYDFYDTYLISYTYYKFNRIFLIWITTYNPITFWGEFSNSFSNSYVLKTNLVPCSGPKVTSGVQNNVRTRLNIEIVLIPCSFQNPLICLL